MNIYRHFTANSEHLKEFPFARELSMQAYLIEHPGILGLDYDSFLGDDVEIIDEEIHIEGGRESKSGNGRLDLLASYTNDYIAVIELKLDEIGQDALKQLEDYLASKAEILKKCNEKNLYSDEVDPKLIGILVGRTISTDLATQLKLGYEYNKIPVAALTIQRFRSITGNIYATTDIYFKDKRSPRDKTKYQFMGSILGKGRLALNIVKQYVDDNPSITYAKLEQVFPKHCQGSQGVFISAEDANRIATEKKSRHFIKPDELIRLKDETIAVSNQWGLGPKANIPNIIKIAKKHGYKISEIES